MKKHDSIINNAYGKVLLKSLPYLAVLMILFAAGCATVGSDFSAERVKDIQLHETTQDDILSMFGAPWRTGIEDGLETWTYGKYRYQLLSETSTKDLVIRFDKNGIVISYSFNTTDH